MKINKQSKYGKQIKFKQLKDGIIAEIATFTSTF